MKEYGHKGCNHDEPYLQDFRVRQADPAACPRLRCCRFSLAGGEEELRDVISFDAYLVTRPQASFILKVTGDSMTGAGIMPGDLVIVEKGRTPKNGSIVVAEVDGDWTMKYFRRDKGRITLEAANPGCPNITPREELRLVGVVTACVRKYAL